MDITISGRDALYTCIDQARTAIVEFSGETVGKYLGASSESTDLHALTHRFEAELPGYRGWHWEVVMAAPPGAIAATVSEVVLVPGTEALRAPNWVPWDQRIRPGDLGPGDLLAPPPNDPRLVPGYTDNGDPEVTETAGEIGLGRKQVLSLAGRVDAAQRWFEGDWGPDTDMARATRRVCRSCGFYLPLAGSLGVAFGACANSMAADGRVVHIEYGCGAHSDTPQPVNSAMPLYEPFDDGVLDLAD
ncbi:DUF3027 domain-containing protein [Mycobacteroides salmoniphilum]|uniref:DUF3027 domain-containing protein n=1 Tax=Mycobacteroides salmoniphilum TaxID=404941 RepID=A0A4R8SJ29_9MYCO|nr:DUF3027 domain-containing protein [Mycobacteroides salmoniphilum]TDZ97256.1 hypothetical protein CCUG60885_00800 [Mycobacteroides salmoniphilum]TEA01487.1 hypothetical protein CCUG60883_04021 [Mycobacteroides salmoniphilum]